MVFSAGSSWPALAPPRVHRRNCGGPNGEAAQVEKRREPPLHPSLSSGSSAPSACLPALFSEVFSPNAFLPSERAQPRVGVLQGTQTEETYRPHLGTAAPRGPPSSPWERGMPGFHSQPSSLQGVPGRVINLSALHLPPL